MCCCVIGNAVKDVSGILVADAELCTGCDDYVDSELIVSACVRAGMVR